MKMKKMSVTAVLKAAAMVFALILPLASCNYFGMPEYELTVTIEEGVVGTPVAGVQVLADLAEVEYKYTPVNPLHTVEVMYEGAKAAASGTVTMYRNITLLARLIDIRAAWTVTLTNNSDGAVNSAPTITFSGSNILGGTFSDSRGYAGAWDAASNKININFGNWENYKLTGTLFSMSGTWANGSATGTWSAVRK
jgi:hypothetical protein